MVILLVTSSLIAVVGSFSKPNLLQSHFVFNTRSGAHNRQGAPAQLTDHPPTGQGLADPNYNGSMFDMMVRSLLLLVWLNPVYERAKFGVLV